MKNAICDVLIVQTSALDEDRMLGETPRNIVGTGPTPERMSEADSQAW